MQLHERIRKLRTNLHLSQEYVAKVLGINCKTFIEIEEGKRNVSIEEVKQLGKLFNVSIDELLNGRCIDVPSTMFMKEFKKLDKEDQKEVLNLIWIKRMKGSYNWITWSQNFWPQVGEVDETFLTLLLNKVFICQSNVWR